MCDGILFLLGLFALIRGKFRFANRDVPKPTGRIIGAMLILPFTIDMFAMFFVFRDTLSSAQPIEDLLSNDAYMNFTSILFLIIIIVVVASGWLIFSRPQTPPPPMINRFPGMYNSPSSAYPFGGVPQPPVAPPAPSIMTTTEAAAYLRVTEPEIITLIDEGKLPAARTASGFRIARSVIDDYVKNNHT